MSGQALTYELQAGSPDIRARSMDWVKLDCPRCKTVSPIPASQAGQYVICPGCQKSVMAPLNAAPAAPPIDQPAPAFETRPGGPRTNDPIGESLAAATNAPAPTYHGGARPAPSGFASSARSPASGPAPPVRNPVAPPAAGQRSTGPRPPSAGIGPQPALATPGQLAVPPIAPGFNGVAPPPINKGFVAPGPQPPPPPQQQPPTKVARFLTADLIPSTVSLSPDGQLPKLTLTDTAKPTEQRSEGSTFNPLVLFAAVAISLCASVMLLMTDFEGAADDEQGAQIRQQLMHYYQGAREPLAPYQAHLREAQQAYSRGQNAVAQTHYRKVLEMLRAEGGSRFRGLTGAPARDKNLEELLSRLLGKSYSTAPPEEP